MLKTSNLEYNIIKGADFKGCIEVVLSVRLNAIILDFTILVSDLVSDN